MFIDTAKITVTAGDGGDGAVAWRKEAFEPAGGPAGGDGGDGGSVILTCTSNIHTLMDFRYKSVYKADNGENGRNKNQYGADGKDIVLKLPVGTLIKDASTGKVIADLNEDGMTYVICKGGKGGKGNSKYKSSTRQAPNFSQRGKKGQSREIILELKLLADVGLVGFPNVGKSSLLSIVSQAKPKIENYHFTTLNPNLGVVRIDYEASFVMADIPGLIEGASQGIGLGHEFLKHIERTKILIHVIDMSGYEGRDPLEDFYSINKELEEYNPKLKDKTQIIYANKMDLPGADENLEIFKDALQDTGIKIFSGSVVRKDNLDGLIKYTWQKLNEEKSKYETYDDILIDDEIEEEIKEISIELVNDTYYVSGDEIVNLISRVNINDHDSLRYFQRQMTEKGIMDMLKEAGVREGDTVVVGDLEFEYLP